MRQAVIWVLLGGSLGGCAARASLDPVRLIAAQASIRSAEEVGAAEVPRAEEHLQLAREGVQRARRLSLGGERARAERQLLRAQADAELALALARQRRAELRAACALREAWALGGGR